MRSYAEGGLLVSESVSLTPPRGGIASSWSRSDSGGYPGSRVDVWKTTANELVSNDFAPGNCWVNPNYAGFDTQPWGRVSAASMLPSAGRSYLAVVVANNGGSSSSWPKGDYGGQIYLYVGI